MNIFKVHKDIRKTGHNYGVPMWFVDCGLGVSYTPEGLLRKLIDDGYRKRDWVVVRDGMKERGLSILVDALKYVGAYVEVEAASSDKDPSWFPKVDSWVVHWFGKSVFNLGALRPRRDIVICSSDYLPQMLEQLGSDDRIDKGTWMGGNLDFDAVWKHRIRVYEREKP